MEKTYLVVTNDINRLRKHGKIIYESKFTNLVGLQTSKSVERIRRVGGVENAEEAATGHLCA